MRTNSLQHVVQANLCLGCGICEVMSGPQPVHMEIDGSGYLRPRGNLGDAAAWQKIKKVCPGIVVTQDENATPNVHERLWGPVRSSHVGHSTDPEVRWKASSGGALSALLIFLLESKLADCIVHVGAASSQPLLTEVHLSRNREQVLANAGSRYAPATPLIGLLEALTGDHARFAFVGKPCDIAALRAFARENPNVEERIVSLISFFCAGTPSLWATHALVDALGLASGDVKQLRYRGFGWPGRATAIDTGGQEHSMSYEESWGGILGPSLQFRCKICPDGIGEFADIVCADAWYTASGLPSFEERPGRSLILVRTVKGEHLLQNGEEQGYLTTEAFDMGELGAIQPYQKRRRQAIAPRLAALRLLGRPTPQFKGFHLGRNAWDGGWWRFLREFLGMLRRCVLER